MFRDLKIGITYDTNRLNIEIFLGFLGKDMTSHWLCHQCLAFYLKPKIYPIFKYGLAANVKVCSAFLLFISHYVYAIHLSPYSDFSSSHCSYTKDK